MKLQNGDKLKIKSDEEARRKYKEYSQLSIGQKLKRNLNIASNFLKSGPNITNFGNAVSALFGGFSPENPDLHYGEAPGVGIKNFGNLVRTARVAREFSNILSKAPKTKEFIMPGLIGWAPKTKFKGYHASNENPFIPDFFREGWAQKTHNAIKGVYIANGKVPGYGFLTKRKYVHPVETTFEKPQIQLGEVKGRTKNSIRNQIERDAQEQGADGIIFKGIADNQMQNQFIAKTLSPDTKIINKSKQDVNKYKREDVLIGDEWGADLYSYPEYVQHRINKIKKISPNTIGRYNPEEFDHQYILDSDFTPMAKMNIGANMKGQLSEIIRRLNSLYKDVPQEVNATIKQQGDVPFVIGYFNNPGHTGMYNPKRNLSLVDPSPKANLLSSIMHEHIMHGTDKWMTKSIAEQYQKFVDPIINNTNGTYKWNGWTYKIPENTGTWHESRATLGEIRKSIYDKLAKSKGIKISPETIEQSRPEFEKTIDNLTIEGASELLTKTGGYGEVYGRLGPKNNPEFLQQFKYLMKVAPATVPFLIPRKEEKK